MADVICRRPSCAELSWAVCIPPDFPIWYHVIHKTNWSRFTGASGSCWYVIPACPLVIFSIKKTFSLFAIFVVVHKHLIFFPSKHHQDAPASAGRASGCLQNKQFTSFRWLPRRLCLFAFIMAKQLGENNKAPWGDFEDNLIVSHFFNETKL